MRNDISPEIRFLDPKALTLRRVAGVAELTDGERDWSNIAVVRAFPTSDADHYIGLIDSDGAEIGILRSPSDLDPASLTILSEELELRYFVPQVERVISVKEEFGSVYWNVETDRGRKEFVVRNPKDNLQELPGNRVILTDIDSNRFEFPDIAKLDRKSQDVLIRSL